MKVQEVTINQKFTVTEGMTSMTVQQQRRMNNKNHFSNTDRCPKSTNSYNVNNEKTTCLKNSKSPLSPGTKENVQFSMKLFSQPSVKPSAKQDYTNSSKSAIVNPLCTGYVSNTFFANMTIIQLRRIKSSLTQSDSPQLVSIVLKHPLPICLIRDTPMFFRSLPGQIVRGANISQQKS